jgi:uncharacterized membrane protein HdeD (DUF308 family)
LLLTGITGVVMLIGAVSLKEMHRKGWLYLFYAALLDVVTAVLLLFTSYSGFGGFVWSLIMTTAGMYFLFQIRSYFTEKGAVPAHDHDHHKDASEKESPKAPKEK